MDKQKILIVNISKGKIGEENTRLLGALIVTNIQLAAMSRVNIPEQKRKNFFLYVDEFQNFATESFINILSEARKYHLCLILAHQYISQMEDAVRDAVFGNVGTIVCFKIGTFDAQLLEKEFEPEFTAQDLINLPKYNFYLKLMINGITSRPFSAVSLLPLEPLEKTYKQEIIEESRKNFSFPREKVEKRIAKETKIENIHVIDITKKSSLYTTFCSICQKKIIVPFKPQQGKNIYCNKCSRSLVKEEKRSEIDEEGSIYLNQDLSEKIVPFTQTKQQRREIKRNEIKKAIEEALTKQITDNKE